LANSKRVLFNLAPALATLAAAALAGCGQPQEIAGGTPGRVHVDGRPLGDVHVSVYAADAAAAAPLGYGISNEQGRFELRQQEPPAPLRLAPGDYRFTVESVGDVVFDWPPPLADPQRTPLRHDWSGEDQELDLALPEPRVPH
jgi:hypothetical protein